MAPRQLTKGFEEEVYVGTWTGEIVGLSHRVAADLAGFSTEPDARNVEFTTEPYLDYEVLICHLMTKRCQLRRYLRELGDYTLVPGSTLSLGGTGEFQLSNPKNPYYIRIRDTYGTDVVTASCHVNVGVEEVSELLRAYRVLRCEASMYLALTAASPFLGGDVTGFHSTRWHVFPKTPPEVPLFADRDTFVRWMEAQLASGVMFNHRHLWLSVRPNGPDSPYQLNRVELRICDRIACPRLIKGVTALMEARVWEVLEDRELDPLRRADEAELLRLASANEEETARSSLSAMVTDWQTGRRLRMRDWIRRRLEATESTARRHGLASHLQAIGETLEAGNTAQQWLERIRRGGTPQTVIRDAVVEMAEIDKAIMGAECA